MELLTQVVEFLRARNAEAYLVGGFVRDLFLSRTGGRDIDLAIRGDAVALARAFANQRGGAFYLMDAEHGVARAWVGGTYVDFAQLRGDLPDDLATRDFTINAMARRADSADFDQLRDPRGLIDPFNGHTDLRAHKIRAVSNAVFKNDPVRLLRAIRIAGELGFTLESETETLIRSDAPLLANAVMERARDEWMKILALADLTPHLRQMEQLGLLSALLPELDALKGLAQPAAHAFDAFEHTLRVVAALEEIEARGYADVADGEFGPELRAHFAEQVTADRSRGVLLRLATILHDVGKPATRSVDEQGKIHFYEHEARGAEIAAEILRRMRFSNAEIETIVVTVKHHLRPLLLSDEPHLTNRAVYRYFRDCQDAGVDVCVLSLADQRGKRARIDAGEDARIRATIARLLARYYRAPETVVGLPRLVDGRELMRELNLAPGLRVGELLEAIREAQAAGEVTTREEAIAFARRIETRNS